MAMLADGLQVGLVVGAARCLIDEVINLTRWGDDTSSKTYLAEVAISNEDALSQLTPRPVISTVFRLRLRYLTPPIN
jgi:hypothetical protein